MTIETSEMKRVATFVDGLTKLSENTGVTVFNPHHYAELRVDGELTGLELADGDDQYAVRVVGLD